VTIGFATDAGLIPDPDVLVDLVAQETQAMRTLVPRLSPAAGTSRTHPRKVSRAGP
jgi:hypothetical protein